MLKGQNIGRLARPLGAAALLFAATIAFDGTSPLSAEPERSTAGIEFVTAYDLPRAGDPAVHDAVTTFITGMAEGDVETVWMFATEEDQDAFGTERAVYEAFAEVFPAFTTARKVAFERVWQEGETPFVTLTLTDGSGEKHRATMGLWLDDAGDWELISCSVEPADDRVA
jgi:hypothetical protein